MNLANSLKSISRIASRGFVSRRINPFGGMNISDPIPNPNRLLGKTAIITGANGYLGKDTAFLFARSGIQNITLTDLDLNKGKKVVEEINEIRKSKIAQFVAGDLMNTNDISNVINKHVSKYSNLSVLFNNAAIMHHNDDTPVSTEEKVWDLTMNINVKAIYLMCKYAIPHLLKSPNSSVVNVASFVALLGAATPQLAYTTSKGAVLAMTREMGIIYAKENVRFNCVSPGPLRTEMLMSFLDNDEKKDRRLVHIPMGRFGESREIAQAVAFLASNESSYVNASNLIVDGGVSNAYVTSI